jgi:dipeptidyl aminopeptidase/acylaminoacyl peptidase
MEKMIKLLGVCLALFFGSLGWAEKQRVMTLEETVTAKYVASAKVSPNGRFTAYTLVTPRKPYIDDDGTHHIELHVVDQSGHTRPFVTGSVSVGNLQWSSDSRYIYYTAKRNDDKFVSIYRIPIDGGESTRVVSYKSNISSFTLSGDNHTLVFLAKKTDEKSVETLKKKGFKAEVYEESDKPTRAFWFDLNQQEKPAVEMAIEGNVLSARFHPTKDQLLVRVAPTPHIDDSYMASEYRIVNRQGLVVKSFKTEGKLAKASWSKDGKYVAIIGAQDKHDPAAGRLFLGVVQTGKIKNLRPQYAGHINDIAWLSDHQLAYLGQVGTSSELAVINLDSDQTVSLVSNGKVVLRSIDVDQSGKTIIATSSSSQHPREVFQIVDGQLKRLTNSNPWLKDIKMPRQESVTYKARDGLELEGILIYPIDYRKGKTYPLIMMVHGGPESHISNEWLDRYSYPIKYAAGHGFAVFLPNYRGSTGRGVEFSKLGQADYAGAEFNDLVDAIAFLSERGIVDKKRVGITGGSYGGYASAWAATALSEHFAASVMFVGISNQLSKFGTTDIPNEMYNVHARNYPWDKWQWMLERSPIYHTDKAKTPLLILHGKNDTRVHPAQSMELYRYIKTRTDTPVRLVYYPGEGHGNRKVGAQLDYAKRLMRWMEFYLKGKNKGKQMPPYELDHAEQLKAKKEKDGE